MYVLYFSIYAFENICSANLPTEFTTAVTKIEFNGNNPQLRAFVSFSDEDNNL